MNMSMNMSMNTNEEMSIHSLNDELGIFLYNLIRLRNNAKITQQEMASLISSSHRNYQRMEKGEAEFSFSQILKISKILRCEVGDLYYFQKGENLKFTELSENYVASKLGLMEFVCFNEKFFHEFARKDVCLKIHDFALTTPYFTNNALPIIIKDSDWEVYNNSCEKLVSQENLLIKRKMGNLFKDKMFMVNLCNRIFRIEKASFYCQVETQFVVNGVERTHQKVFYVIRRPNNKLYVSATAI